MKSFRKTLIALSMSVILAVFGVSVTTAFEPELSTGIELKLRGDLDGDTVVGVDDAIYLLRHILMPDSYPVKQSGDMDRDGVCNVDDAIFLLRHTMMPDRYPLECAEHVPTAIPEVAPGCTTVGYTEGSECSVCGEILVEPQEVAAIGHSVVTVQVIEPTCIEQGYTDRVCTTCDEHFVEEIVEPLGHELIEVEVVPPTCTEEGYTDNVCVKCDEHFHIDIVEPLGHDFDETILNYNGTHHGNGCKNEGCDALTNEERHTFENDCDATCDVCGYIREPLHTGGIATCTERAVCEVCNEEYGEFAEHEFSKKITAAKYLKGEADCENAAEYYYSCACGEKSEESFAFDKALGHNYGEYITNEENTGHYRHCERCGKDEVAESHSGGTATCIEKSVCEVCNAVYGELAEHNYIEGTCEHCGDVFQSELVE